MSRKEKDNGTKALLYCEFQETRKMHCSLGKEWEEELAELKNLGNLGSLSQVDLVDSSGVFTIQICIYTTRTVNF